jgi:hypothetical protein
MWIRVQDTSMKEIGSQQDIQEKIAYYQLGRYALSHGNMETPTVTAVTDKLVDAIALGREIKRLELSNQRLQSEVVVFEAGATSQNHSCAT